MSPSIIWKRRSERGFTLIELSIVLVIIGLIVGGVLAGQDLIRAAGERATISQIEKYNTAANTFRDKYGYLPGDIKNPDAANFGFITRGNTAGDGDGNGVLEWDHTDANTYAWGAGLAVGEEGMFWVDLSTAHLIDGGFSSSVPEGNLNGGASIAGAAVSNYLPQAKLGGGNYIFVWSGGLAASGWNLQSEGNGINYFGIEVIPLLRTAGVLNNNGAPGLTVRQAYDIDTKIDDGLPQQGNVKAQYVSGAGGGDWVANTGFAVTGPPYTYAVAGSSTTCYDNSTAPGGTPGVVGVAQHYSMEISSGSNVTCALSFRFQ